MGLIAVDTTFLIDWSSAQGRSLPEIQEFLSVHRQDQFVLSLTVLGEFAAGFANPKDPALLKVRNLFQLLPSDEAVAMAYREIFRHLKAKGKLIGANDLWIAAHALRHGVPCVTRNRVDFQRVPGLTVLNY